MLRWCRFVSSVLFALMAMPAVAQDHVVFNGGVTSQARAEAPRTGTRLEFFATSGAYLSDVAVTVSDSDGNELVDTVTNGPWLILDLPAGTYNVSAGVEGYEPQSLRIEVSGTSDSQAFGFAFPQS